MEVTPSGELKGVRIDERGATTQVNGVAYSQNLPDHVVNRMRHAAMKKLVSVESVKIEADIRQGPSTGAGIFLLADCGRTLIGESALGQRGVRAETLGETCAEDLQEMAGYMQQPIPVGYTYSCVTEMCIEPSTGAVVDIYRNEETLSMRLDYDGLTGLFSVLMKYQQDPVLGPEIDKISELQALAVQTEPQKVVAYEYSQTDGSVNRNIRDARDAKSLLKLVRLWLPIIVTVVGVLILLLGLALLSSAKRDRRTRI